jgi:MraZ protein
MFRGQFQHSIDKKGRISLPARFREKLEADGDARVVIAPWPFDECLHLYPLSAWEEFEAKIAALPRLNKQINQFRRMYISRALDIDVDGSGRVRIPADMQQHAGLSGEGLWAGMGSHIELWSKPQLDTALHMDDQELSEFRDKVEEMIPL